MKIILLIYKLATFLKTVHADLMMLIELERSSNATKALFFVEWYILQFYPHE